jgi:hypothetical protein
MKKVLVLSITLALILSLSACVKYGNENSGTNSTSSTNSSESSSSSSTIITNRSQGSQNQGSQSQDSQNGNVVAHSNNAVTDSQKQDVLNQLDSELNGALKDVNSLDTVADSETTIN